MLNLVILISLLAAILINVCAASPKPATMSDFEELCRALGKTDGKISKEDLLAAAQNKEQAEKIFDLEGTPRSTRYAAAAQAFMKPDCAA